MVLSPPASSLASAVLSRLSLRLMEDDPVITQTADRAVVAGLMTERDWVSDHGVHYVITSVLHLRQCRVTTRRPSGSGSTFVVRKCPWRACRS